MTSLVLTRDRHETGTFAHRCASCGRLLGDAGEWGHPRKPHHDVRGEASHGICPSCATSLYPDIRLGLIS